MKPKRLPIEQLKLGMVYVSGDRKMVIEIEEDPDTEGGPTYSLSGVSLTTIEQEHSMDPIRRGTLYEVVDEKEAILDAHDEVRTLIAKQAAILNALPTKDPLRVELEVEIHGARQKLQWLEEEARKRKLRVQAASPRAQTH